MVRDGGRGETEFRGIADNDEFAEPGDNPPGLGGEGVIPDAIEKADGGDIDTGCRNRKRHHAIGDLGEPGRRVVVEHIDGRRTCVGGNGR